jgi:hypothetical protein
VLLAVLGASGCASVGPTSVDRDRLDYIKAIATSWKRSDLRELKVVYGAIAEADDVIAIQTRSGLQIMVELGSDIQVPSGHVAGGRTFPSSAEPRGRAGGAAAAGAHPVGDLGAGG